MIFFIIGFMGSGKSYWGKHWSANTKLPLIELDKIIEQKENASIAEIFEQKGEEYFRKIETETLMNIELSKSCIVSCGGGTPCFYNNMEWMNAHGTTIYLKAEVEFLFHNVLKKLATRPLFNHKTNAEIYFYIEHKLSQRQKFYNLAKKIILVEDAEIDSLKKII